MFERTFRIWIANKRLKDKVAVCEKGHRQKSVTHVQRGYGQPTALVCYECFIDWIISNVPGVEIIEEKGDDENAG